MHVNDPVNVYTTFGALEIGLFLGIFLFGISTAQVSIYYQRFPRDDLNIKSLVAVVWLLDLGHSMLTGCLVYTLCVEYYGRPNDLNKFTCLYTVILFGSAMTWVEQTFFSYRISKIMDRPIFGAACGVLSTARFLACVVLAADAYREPTFRALTHDYGWLMTTVLIASAAVDVIIAVILTYSLVQRRDNILSRTAKVLDRLIVWTLQTGLITSITASAMVLTFKIMPANYIWLGIYMFLGKLYSNSLLASLNGRMQLRSTMAKVSMMRGIKTTFAHGVHATQVVPPVVSIEMSPTQIFSDKSATKREEDEDNDGRGVVF